MWQWWNKKQMLESYSFQGTIYIQKNRARVIRQHWVIVIGGTVHTVYKCPIYSGDRVKDNWMTVC